MNKQYYQSRTGFITQSALIAALYVVLTMIVAPIAFGPIQFRVSEVLCVLPYFLISAVPGVTIGCFLANLLCGAASLDVVFGSIATLIGAVGSYYLGKKNKWLETGSRKSSYKINDSDSVLPFRVIILDI